MNIWRCWCFFTNSGAANHRNELNAQLFKFRMKYCLVYWIELAFEFLSKSKRSGRALEMRWLTKSMLCRCVDELSRRCVCWWLGSRCVYRFACARVGSTTNMRRKNKKLFFKKMCRERISYSCHSNSDIGFLSYCQSYYGAFFSHPEPYSQVSTPNLLHLALTDRRLWIYKYLIWRYRDMDPYRARNNIYTAPISTLSGN